MNRQAFIEAINKDTNLLQTFIHYSSLAMSDSYGHVQRAFKLVPKCSRDGEMDYTDVYHEIARRAAEHPIDTSMALILGNLEKFAV